MKSSKKKTFWKYLLGIGSGGILVCATIGSVVSCSNGSTNTASSTSTNSSQNKNSTPTSSSTSTSNSSTLNDTQTYQLMDRYNTATIAYKDSQNALTNKISMVTTNNDVTNYSKWLNEPDNIIVSILGEPEAVINVANDTNSKTAPNINLSLNPNSALYKECLARTNNATDLTSLSNLITFSTTNKSSVLYNFDINNLSINSAKNVVQTNSWTFSLADFVPQVAWKSNSTVKGIGTLNNGLNITTSVDTLWSNLHPINSKSPTATFTSTNYLYLKNGKQIPFELTINLLPLIKYVQTPTTIDITNTKTGTWTSAQIPQGAIGFFDDNGTWWANITNNYGIPNPTFIPPTTKTVNYMYITGEMIGVGTATVNS